MPGMMTRVGPWVALSGLVLCCGCGDTAAQTDSDTEATGGGTGSTTSAVPTSTSSASTTGDTPTGSGSATGDGTTGTAADTSGTADPGTGTGTTAAGTTGDADTGTTAPVDPDTGSTGTTDTTGTTGTTGEPIECGEVGGDLEFSYIWISNTGESTLSKLNTVSLVEEGRYITRADKAGSPSRTSVSLLGDVVVANRSGGLTKFYARAEDCVESNGMPGIQTSTGKLDVLAWNLEECRAWHTPAAVTSQRPVAWTSGVQNPVTCAWEGQKIWSSTSMLGQPGSMKVLRLDGDTGVVEATVDLPAVDIGAWGAYGGAVDGENNFWLSTHGSAQPPSMTRVRFDDLSVKTWPTPPGVAPYGMTVDAKGRAWVAGYQGGVARFSPETETWDVVPGVTGLGLQADGEGRVWVGAYPTAGVTAIDVDTLAVVQTIPIAANVTKGVSIDFFGNVWAVSMGAEAYRVNPETLQIDVYAGLNSAYTYSDMTGYGLLNVIPQ